MLYLSLKNLKTNIEQYKCTYSLVGRDYRFATLSILYLTIKLEPSHRVLNRLDNYIILKITIRAFHYKDSNYRKNSLLKLDIRLANILCKGHNDRKNRY